MNAQILIVEDHRDLAHVIALALENENYLVDFASNGDVALQLLQQQNFDLVVLDLMLPGLDGLSICQHMREKLNLDIPVLMLTAKDTLQDKIEGFDKGADDYLIKPFDMSELLVRIRALLKRQHGQVTLSIREIGDLQLDSKAMQVQRAGQHIELSPIAFSILQILMRESPNIVSRAQLEQEIWGEDLPDSDALRSHLYSLRKAVDKPFDKQLIHTYKGRGVCIVA